MTQLDISWRWPKTSAEVISLPQESAIYPDSHNGQLDIASSTCKTNTYMCPTSGMYRRNTGTIAEQWQLRIAPRMTAAQKYPIWLLELATKLAKNVGKGYRIARRSLLYQFEDKSRGRRKEIIERLLKDITLTPSLDQYI